MTDDRVSALLASLARPPPAGQKADTEGPLAGYLQELEDAVDALVPPAPEASSNGGNETIATSDPITLTVIMGPAAVSALRRLEAEGHQGLQQRYLRLLCRAATAANAETLVEEHHQQSLDTLLSCALSAARSAKSSSTRREGAKLAAALAPLVPPASCREAAVALLTLHEGSHQAKTAALQAAAALLSRCGAIKDKQEQLKASIGALGALSEACEVHEAEQERRSSSSKGGGGGGGGSSVGDSSEGSMAAQELLEGAWAAQEAVAACFGDSSSSGSIGSRNAWAGEVGGKVSAALEGVARSMESSSGSGSSETALDAASLLQAGTGLLLLLLPPPLSSASDALTDHPDEGCDTAISSTEVPRLELMAAACRFLPSSSAAASASGASGVSAAAKRLLAVAGRTVEADSSPSASFQPQSCPRGDGGVAADEEEDVQEGPLEYLLRAAEEATTPPEEARFLQGFCLAAAATEPGRAHGSSSLCDKAAALAVRTAPTEADFADEAGNPVRKLEPPQGSKAVQESLCLAVERLQALGAAVRCCCCCSSSFGSRGRTGSDEEEEKDSSAAALLRNEAVAAALNFLRHPELPAAWSTAATSKAAEALLCSLASSAAAPSVASGCRIIGVDDGGNGPSSSELLRALLPFVVRRIREVVVQQHTKTLDDASLRPYSGPGTFARALAAHCLATCLHGLPYPHMNGAVDTGLLPVALAACEDPSPSVQRSGLASLSSLVEQGLPAELQPFKQLLLDSACRCVVTADANVWPAAAWYAVSLAVALEGPDSPSSAVFSRLMIIFLDAAELHVTYPDRSMAFLAAVRPLVVAMKLKVVAHFSRLMPLLSEWLQAPARDLQAKAAETLKAVMEVTWPRIPAHGEFLLKALNQARSMCMSRSPAWDTRPTEDAIKLLRHICGPELK